MNSQESVKPDATKEVSAVFACAKACHDAAMKLDSSLPDFTALEAAQREEAYRGVIMILQKLGLPTYLEIGEMRKLIFNGLKSSLPQEATV